MELQYTKPRSQKPTSGPSPKPAQISSKLHVVPSLNPILISHSYSRICLLKFPNQTLCLFHVSPIRATGLQHPLAPKLLGKKVQIITRLYVPIFFSSALRSQTNAKQPLQYTHNNPKI